MENQEETRYVKPTQKDFSMSFKLQIVQEIEGDYRTVDEATKKYKIQCWKTVVNWLKEFDNFD